MDFNIMLVAIPIFFLLILTEYLIAKHQKKEVYRLNDTISNLNIGIGNQIVSVLTKGALFAVIYFVYENFALVKLGNSVLVFIVALIAYDFLYYWAHRWGHTVNLFWGAHVVHHQSEEYNLSVALRQSWFHHLLAFPIFLPLPLLGFNPIILGLVSIVATLYQFWIHTKTIDKMPAWVEWLFNTPSHHRVHHGVNPDYIDKNHGAIFIIWDRMFGTYQEENETAVYGITDNYKSFNPVKANVDYYIYLVRMMKNFSFINKLKSIIAAPGWSPETQNNEDYSVDLNRKKYNPILPKGFSIYALIQFAFIIWGTIAYMNNFDELIVSYQIYFAGLLMLSIVICSGILEAKKWVFFAEYARLILVAVSLNAIYYFKYMDWFTLVFVLSIVALTFCIIWFSISLKRNYRSLLIA